MVFDPNAKNIVPLYLATVKDGKYQFRRYPMQAPYATVGQNGVHYNGPPVADEPAAPARFGLFGPGAESLAANLSPLIGRYGGRYSLVGVSSDVPWGKASSGLVKLIYEDHVLGIVATGRNSSHLAEQLAIKAFVPLIAVSADRNLTSVNIPWIFRLPEETPLADALHCFVDAAERSGPNRGRLRDTLASGAVLAGGLRFDSNGELHHE